MLTIIIIDIGGIFQQLSAFFLLGYVALSQNSRFEIASSCSTLSTPLLSLLWFRSITSKEKSEYVSPFFKIFQWFSWSAEKNLIFFFKAELKALQSLDGKAHFSRLICHFCPLISYVPPRQDRHPTASYLLSTHCSQCLNWLSSVCPTSVLP